MAFEITTSSYRLERRRGTPVKEAVRAGLYAGVGAAFFGLIGAQVAMDQRFIIVGLLTLSQGVLIALVVAAGMLEGLAPEDGDDPARTLTRGAVAGLVAGLVLGAMMLLVANVNLRSYLVAASPQLVRSWSFGAPPGSGGAAAVLAFAGLVLGVAGATLALIPGWLRRAILAGVGGVAAAGLFRDVFTSILANFAPPGVPRAIFGESGVRLLPAAAIFAIVAAFSAWRSLTGKAGDTTDTGRRRRVGLVVMLAALVVLPLITNDFIGQVMILVALYILMSTGLHIELGLAGLVDLGFVAFYAIGAYTVALLCSESPIAIASLSFWAALPIAILVAALAGLLFGLPVLRVRGDYLALATLGLGEIIRVLVVSDMLTPTLGGSQGIIAIRRPEIGVYILNTPLKLYFFALALAGVAALVSHLLRSSWVGRAWLAIREDEEVAQGLGIDLVAVKLLAYTIGAAFAGAAGAVFAVLIGAVYPHSFQLLISVNLLAILVIGGLGSLPGVVIGALVLIGLPELFREFGEFRYLFYGLALVTIVHFRPDGLWPVSARISHRGL